ncbi:MAG: phosphoribosyltransferase family protein [Candidatus Pacebacteria bacterium]|nr:phosphoribosyltransferase family protein [Candidatus Paceibacterota bacterium]
MENFQARDVCRIMDERQVRAVISKMAREVADAYRNDLANLVFLGVARRGVPIAKMAGAAFKEQTGASVLVAAIDAKIYNDDLTYVSKNGQAVIKPFENSGLKGKIAVVWDDVAYTLQTFEAIYPAIRANGPTETEFAVLVDRFQWHKKEREIYAPRFFGLRQETSSDQIIKVHMPEFDGDMCVWLQERF